MIAANGNITEDSCLTIAEGNGESERVGRKVTVRNIVWRYELGLNTQANSASPAGNEVIRVVLYLDKQTNGATATVAGVFESDDYQSFRNLANSGRFDILMDKTYSFTFGAGAGDGSAANDWLGKNVSGMYSKKCSIPIEYDNSATTGVITSMRSNNIGVLLFSKTGTTGFFVSKMRIRYSDQ